MAEQTAAPHATPRILDDGPEEVGQLLAHDLAKPGLLLFGERFDAPRHESGSLAGIATLSARGFDQPYIRVKCTRGDAPTRQPLNLKRNPNGASRLTPITLSTLEVTNVALARQADLFGKGILRQAQFFSESSDLHAL